jgi:hypothetical protein
MGKVSTLENLPCVIKSLILSILEGISPPPWVLLVQYPLMSLAHLPNNFRPVGNKISWSKMRGLLTPKSNKVFSK